MSLDGRYWSKNPVYVPRGMYVSKQDLRSA